MRRFVFLAVLALVGCADFTAPKGYRLVCIPAHTDSIFAQADANDSTSVGIVGTIAYPDYCQWRLK